MQLNTLLIVATILSATMPKVLAEVEAVCPAEVANLSVPGGETVDVDLTAATLQHSKHIQES